MTDGENRYCDEHGWTLFIPLKNRKSFCWVCQKCRRIQCAKAQEKRRLKPEVREYQKNYSNSYNSIRKSLSVYLAMILLAAKIKPE